MANENLGKKRCRDHSASRHARPLDGESAEACSFPLSSLLVCDEGRLYVLEAARSYKGGDDRWFPHVHEISRTQRSDAASANSENPSVARSDYADMEQKARNRPRLHLLSAL